MQKSKLEIAIDLAVTAFLIWYVIDTTNPTLKYQIQNDLRKLRWKMWLKLTPPHLLEAYQVRGYLP